ncbi:MAG: hypothetical protein K2M94_00340 [Paramuribaculum sp.]|nr:hypothetical protein [Paramuribaculum sp.]
MFHLVQIIVPVSICVVLPAVLVWIVFRSRNNKVNKNAEIVIKAIESNSSIDADKLVAALGTTERTPGQILQLRLLRGCMFTLAGLIVGLIELFFDSPMSYFMFLCSGLLFAVGISYLIVYFVTRNNVDEADEK